MINTGSANAQQASEEHTSEVIEEIVEVEARDMYRQVEREGALGIEFETIKLNRPVSYADLDLSEQADVILLETRIETTAKESCEQLSDMFPLAPSSQLEIWRCTKRTVDRTEEDVQVAVAAAN